VPENIIKVLLVEDNPAQAVLVREELLEAGRGQVEVTSVETLRRAREHISQFPVQAILLDLSLPDSSGLDTLAEIQQSGPDFPILVLTGNEDESLAKQAVGMGAADYLFKGDMHGPLLFRSIQYAIQRKKHEVERERLISELQAALAEVKRLSGFLPICASCKSIRNDKGYWLELERYMAENTEIIFSHGICPACMQKLYPEIFNEEKEK
jgi:DNA-binding response OmpR family regulator